MRGSRAVVEDVLAAGEPVYGLTTGVGERKSFLLDPAERQRFNLRLVLNHRIAQGDAAPADVVRGAMLCLANSYAKGVTGVRPELAEMIVTLLNEGFAPPVRRLGSIGQGDLGPMADLAHGMITRSGFEVAENEGLALVAGALDLEAFGANLNCLHPVIEQTRPFPGLAGTLHQLRLLLAASYLWQLLVAAGRGPVPAGSADLPLHPAHPRCGPGRAGLHPDHLAARAQLLAVQPGRGAARRR
jgi:histidine ammonia-lyase